MTKRQKSTTAAPQINRKIELIARSVAGRIKVERFDRTGARSRVRGHISAHGRRSQARRDAR